MLQQTSAADWATWIGLVLVFIGIVVSGVIAFIQFSKRAKVTCTLAPMEHWFMWSTDDPDTPALLVLRIEIFNNGHKAVNISSVGLLLKDGRRYSPPDLQQKLGISLLDGDKPETVEINLEELSEASREEGPFIWAFAQEAGGKEYRGSLPIDLVEKGIAKRPTFLQRIVRRRRDLFGYVVRLVG
ncbi:MAG: hypothetical protein WA996_22715 [Candidatus Promineifilaceae bacterium]